MADLHLQAGQHLWLAVELAQLQLVTLPGIPTDLQDVLDNTRSHHTDRHRTHLVHDSRLPHLQPPPGVEGRSRHLSVGEAPIHLVVNPAHSLP